MSDQPQTNDLLGDASSEAPDDSSGIGTDLEQVGDRIQEIAASVPDGEASTEDPGDASEPQGSAGSDEPRPPAGRVQIPDDPRGHYVVLWARKPTRGDKSRPGYQEVDCVAAGTPDFAKRIVIGDTDRAAPFADFLRHSAAQRPGILLRAVPAIYWPRDVKATTYTRPAPVLEIG